VHIAISVIAKKIVAISLAVILLLFTRDLIIITPFCT
jgi:hypothetical protein